MGCSSPHTFLYFSKPLCSLEIHCPGDTPASVHDSSTQTSSNSQAMAPFNTKAPTGVVHMTDSTALLLRAPQSFFSQLCPELP